MEYEFLYTTNKMNTNKVIEYLFDLFNKGKTENEGISKCNIEHLVEEVLPRLVKPNGGDFFSELMNQIGPAGSKIYVSKAETLEQAVKDFFNQEFSYDLWHVDPEVEVNNNNSESKFIDIRHFKEWDF